MCMHVDGQDLVASVGCSAGRFADRPVMPDGHDSTCAGGDETVALVETGELVPLLIAADVPVPPVLEDRRAANKGGGKP